MKVLVNFAIALSFLTIALGAYTRLTDAGLGCPDWPGCYGAMAAPLQAAQIEQAQHRFPQANIEPHKARNEMLHRYVAGSLGLDVLAIFVLSIVQKCARIFSVVILVLVVAQATLGMLTVNLNLLPLVVLGHLLGGFSLLSLLVLLRLHLQKTHAPVVGSVSVKIFGWCALAVLLVQISLGAWTSSNYAALVCHDLPVCEAGWQKKFTLSAAFQLPRGHSSYEYGVLNHDARVSIHVLHRLGAMITLLTLGAFAFFYWRKANTLLLRRLALTLAGLLFLQLCLGLINVIAFLPLANAVAHNLVAASLLMVLAVCIYQLHRRTN